MYENTGSTQFLQAQGIPSEQAFGVPSIAIKPPGRKDFFAVDRRTWAKVCALGSMDVRIAFLVLARGTGGDNRTTAWSAKAIKCRIKIRWCAAKEAIGGLINGGVMRQDKNGDRPRYYILPEQSEKPEWIWFPNALIDGAGDETPPIELIRQSHQPEALRLIVDLYGAQDLIEYGGIHWTHLRQIFTRNNVAECGAYNIFGFECAHTSTVSLTAPFVEPYLTGKKENPCPLFWESLKILMGIGLGEFVEYIIDDDADSDAGMILHPYGATAGEPGEREIGDAAGDAALSMLAQWRQDLVDNGSHDYGLLLPALKHLRDVQMVGIFRLKYRAQTSATAAWLSNAEEWARRAAKYKAMCAGDRSAKIKVV